MRIISPITKPRLVKIKQNVESRKSKNRVRFISTRQILKTILESDFLVSENVKNTKKITVNVCEHVCAYARVCLLLLGIITVDIVLFRPKELINFYVPQKELKK